MSLYTTYMTTIFTVLALGISYYLISKNHKRNKSSLDINPIYHVDKNYQPIKTVDIVPEISKVKEKFMEYDVENTNSIINSTAYKEKHKRLLEITHKDRIQSSLFNARLYNENVNIFSNANYMRK